jgi:hypothetical protein
MAEQNEQKNPGGEEYLAGCNRDMNKTGSGDGEYQQNSILSVPADLHEGSV